jgi:hypothetical protein
VSATPAARNFSPENLRHVLRHGISTAGFCCVIALGMAVSNRAPWAPYFVYSVSIGLVSWLGVDIGRLLLAGRSAGLADGRGADAPTGLRDRL